MKKFTTLTLGALSLVALASGCSVDTATTEEVGTNQEAAICSNDQATFAVMASFAVGMAKDTRRWLPMRDLQWNNSTGKLEMSTAGKDRCWVPGDPVDSSGKKIKNCKAMNTLLRLQDDSSSGMQFAGASLSPGVLRSRLYAYWQRQVTCSTAPDNGAGDNCPWERHDLVFSGTATGANTCTGGLDYWYHAYYGDTTTNLSSSDAAQLKNQLIWAGGTVINGVSENPFLAFDSVGGNVKIDPVEGTTGGSGSGSGSCEVAANPVWVNNAYRCDNTNVTKTIGSCCSCGGQNRTWKAALSAGWFACKL